MSSLMRELVFGSVRKFRKTHLRFKPLLLFSFDTIQMFAKKLSLLKTASLYTDVSV